MLYLLQICDLERIFSYKAPSGEWVHRLGDDVALWTVLGLCFQFSEYLQVTPPKYKAVLVV